MLQKMSNKRILMICGQEIIKKQNDGGKKCSYRNYELYKSVFGEQNFYLIMYSDSKEQSDDSHIIRMPSHKNRLMKVTDILKGNVFTNVIYEEETIKFIEQERIDIVIFERSIFGSMIKKIKEKGLKCQIWIFVHNVEKRYFANKVKHQAFFFLLPYLIVSKSEIETIKNSDYVITLTKRDSYYLDILYGKKSNLILPMTFKDSFNKKNIINEDMNHSRTKNLLIFIGTLFLPNYKGIKWFIDNVMSELPNCELYIIGKDFEKKKEELERENVIVIGTADNLEQYYYSDSIMVMPIFFGDGMKIKTAEAMMYGKTILATDEALEGYDIEGAVGIYRCNSKEDFIQSINYSFSQPGYSYREDVRNLFLSKYCFDNQIIECKRKWLK